MDRRKFITQSCGACLAVAGMGVLFSSCGSALPLVKTTSEAGNIVRVPVSSFNDETNMILLRNSTLSNDILLVKAAEGYRALYMRCTHENFGLTATNKKIFCSSHGSEFDFEGKVLKEPALSPLKKFKTETINNDIIIHLT
jgi:cytochrome b6-f complex iron-sulfur subunit